MNSKFRALLWEQWRVAGVISLVCLLVAVIALLMLFPQIYSSMLAADTATAWLLSSLGWLTVILLSRQTSDGRIACDFDPRLSRLPVSTAMLTWVPLVFRLFCLIGYFCCISAAHRLIVGEALPLAFLVYALTAHVALQTTIWIRTDLNYAPVLIVVYAILRFTGVVPRGNWAADALAALTPTRLAWVCVCVFPVLLAVARAGVQWERNSVDWRYFSIPRLDAVASSLRRRRRRGFATIAEALAWYERGPSGGALMGALLSGYVVVFMLTLFVAKSVSPSHVSRSSMIELPLIVVPLVFAALGIARDFTRSAWPLALTEFQTSKPIAAAALAWTHISVMFIRVLTAVSLAGLLSLALYVSIHPDIAQWRLNAILSGDVSSAALFLMPPALSFAAAWLALWCFPVFPLFGLMIMYEVVMPPVPGRSTVLQIDGAEMLFYAFAGYAVIRSVRLFLYAHRRGVMKPPALAVFALLHLVLALALWMPGPADVAFVAETLFLTFAFVALLLSPILALPRRIERKRIMK